MEIYIVRHGETVWNAEKRLQGNTDIELNANGRKLAGITGRNLANVPFDKIYSSPLIRAYETACLIRGYRNIPIVRDDRLRELSFGVNEGRRYEELVKDENETFRYFFDRPERYVAPSEGESLEHICVRAADFLSKVVEPQRERMERVMIVAHGALNKALMCHIGQHGVDQYWSGGFLKNVSVLIVRLDADGYHTNADPVYFY